MQNAPETDLKLPARLTSWFIRSSIEGTRAIVDLVETIWLKKEVMRPDECH